MTLSCRRCLLVLKYNICLQTYSGGRFDPITPFLASNYLSADLLPDTDICTSFTSLNCFITLQLDFSIIFLINFIIIGEMRVILLTRFGSLQSSSGFFRLLAGFGSVSPPQDFFVSLPAHQSSQWLPSGSFILDCLVPIFS